MAVVGSLAVVAASYEAIADQIPWRVAVFVGIYAVVVLLAFLRRIAYQVQIGLVVVLLCGFGAYNLIGFGLNAESALFFLAAAFIAALFFDRRGAVLSVVAVLAILAIVGWLFATGRVVVYVATPTRSADWEGWLTFFLRGVVEVSAEAAETARCILDLRELHRLQITDRLGRTAGNGHKVLETLFDRPIVSVADVQQVTGTTYVAANNLVARLVQLGILAEITGNSRNRRFRYEPYVRLFLDEEWETAS